MAASSTAGLAATPTCVTSQLEVWMGIPGSGAAGSMYYPTRTVTVTPGATVHTVLRIANANNYPNTMCKPVTATSIKVYPPNNTVARPAPWWAPAT